MHTTIAMDGPAGSGKSTVALCVAEKLGFLYLDTGAMYRAVTVLSLRHQYVSGSPQLTDIVRRSHIEFTDNGKVVLLDGEDISTEIRMPEVNKLVADVAKIPEIRHEIVKHQQRLGAKGSLVAEGRDLTTIVFPNADFKFYLNASVKERARRRLMELRRKNVRTTSEEVEAEIRLRDEKDISREHSPLRMAEDAIVVDTTHKTIHDVVNFIVGQVQEP